MLNRSVHPLFIVTLEGNFFLLMAVVVLGAIWDVRNACKGLLSGCCLTKEPEDSTEDEARNKTRTALVKEAKRKAFTFPEKMLPSPAAYLLWAFSCFNGAEELVEKMLPSPMLKSRWSVGNAIGNRANLFGFCMHSRMYGIRHSSPASAAGIGFRGCGAGGGGGGGSSGGLVCWACGTGERNRSAREEVARWCIALGCVSSMGCPILNLFVFITPFLLPMSL